MGRADDATGTGFRPGLSTLLALLIAVGSGAWFAHRLDDEPIFVDEAAFISQAYFGDLLLSGRVESPLWLEYQAYDLPPLPKYLINLSLRVHGQARPRREWALWWYEHTLESRFVTPATLHAARLPSILMGVLGCVSVFSLGVTAGDRRIGFLAAAFLAISPLYALHARRAMADVPAEALVLATAALGLALVMKLRRGGLGAVRLLALSVAVGGLGGLAVLAKLNGGLGLLLIAAWMIFAGLAPSRQVSKGRFAVALASIGVTALLVFVALNPFVTARPRSLGTVPLLDPKPPNQTIPERLWEVVEHRVAVSRIGQASFPRDALPTLSQKAAVLAVQGFGRFGPLGPRRSDSTRRFDWSQDRGAIAWLPLVLGGFVAWPAIGFAQRRRGQPSAAWAIPLGFVVCVATVGAFLPLAWDRYLLPIQAMSGLMAAGAVVAVFDRLTRRGGPA